MLSINHVHHTLYCSSVPYILEHFLIIYVNLLYNLTALFFLFLPYHYLLSCFAVMLRTSL